ncbi:MAG: hypothetical protein ACI9TH_003620 [Kiritimatiellia bacterium]|jgi:hypothetical protein
MKYLRTLLIFTSLLLLSACDRSGNAETYTPSGELDIQVRTSQDSIRVGDVIQVRVSVYHPPEGLITTPEFDHPPQVVVRSRSSSTKAYDDTHALTEIAYELTSYRVGKHHLSTGTVTCVISGAANLKAGFPETLIQVTSVLADDQKAPAELRELHEPKSPMPWLLLTIVAIVLVAIILAIVIAMLVKKPSAEPVAPPPPPAHELAIAALIRLKGSGLIEERAFEPFYVKVSDILRTYIEGRFGLDAPDMTTEEFMQEAGTSHILSPDHQDHVHQFLAECDMVKFARLEPSEESMQQVLGAAQHFVGETRPGGRS